MADIRLEVPPGAKILVFHVPDTYTSHEVRSVEAIAERAKDDIAHGEKVLAFVLPESLTVRWLEPELPPETTQGEDHG
jgi:hypothetical protein